MSILIDEFYKKYKVEATICLIAAMLIGFLWKSLAELLPFAATIKIELLWCIKVISSLIVIIFALGTYIVCILRKKSKYKDIDPVDLNKYLG